VEEGGETEFKSLGIKARPKKGRALLWPSTFDARPLEQDSRTFPQPQPKPKT
jgi:prolyl 4-hydroxylase